MTITIRDVARRAEVSVKTVSRAINGHPDVSATTRAVVQDAVRALGFQPSPLARGLRTGSSRMIAFLIPDMLNPYYAELARHVQARTNADGYMLVLANNDYDPALTLANLRSIIAHRVDGLIWKAGLLNGDALAAVLAARLPTVVVGGPVPDGIDHIRGLVRAPAAPTYELAAYAATEHLLRLGHRRLAYLTEAPEEGYFVGQRLSGFRRALADHGLPPEEAIVRTSAFLQMHKLEGGHRLMNGVLAEGHRPTGILTSSDLVAIGILRSLRDHGWRVPHDVSVVGCDDIQQASYTDPPLTTIRTPHAELSAAILGLLHHLIDPARHPEPTLEVGYTLVVRSSTGPAPAPADAPSGAEGGG